MKKFVLMLLLVPTLCYASYQNKPTTNEKVQKYNVVTNSNDYYFVFVNDSTTGSILKDANVKIINDKDTVIGKKSNFMSPDNPFEFSLKNGKVITISVTCEGYKSATYETIMSVNKKWFESQLIKQ